MKKTFVTLFGFVLAATLSGCSPVSSSTSGPAAEPTSSTTQTPEVVETANPMDCISIKNIGNKIKLNQPRFSGDPDPTDIFVATQFLIKNSCDQDVIGLKGSESFQNVVGDELFRGDFTSDLTIEVGTSKKTSGTSGYTFNQFEDAYGVLASTNQAKTLAVVELTKIVFADGTALEN